MATLTTCGTLTAGITIDCNNLPSGGTADRLIIINRSDVDFDSATYDMTVTSQVTTLPLLSGGKQGWEFGGINNSIVPRQEQLNQGFVPKYAHEITFTAFAKTQAAKDVIENLAKGRYVAVVEYQDNTFEIYGFGVGMAATAVLREQNNTETGGAYVVTLRTPESQSGEPKLPRTLLNTDYTTTLAAVTGYLTPTA